MKEYEVIHEMLNLCPGNQMRDIFIEEIMIEDPEEYVKNKFKNDNSFRYEVTEKEDGSLVFEIMTASLHQRYTFSEI